MKFMKTWLSVLLLIPNLVCAGQNHSSFGVTFTIVPSCYIKTEKILGNNIKIVSFCSHEDFYLTTDKLSTENNITVKQSTLNVVKNNDNNTSQTVVNNLTNQTLLTLNF